MSSYGVLHAAAVYGSVTEKEVLSRCGTRVHHESEAGCVSC